MAEGVQIKIGTDQAVEAQKKLDAATKETFVALDQQNKKVQALEAQLAALSSASTSVGTTARSTTAPLQKVSTDIGIYGAKAAATSKTLLDLREKSAQSVAGTDALGKSSNATAGFLQKLLAAAGQGGAAKGVGLLSAGARALATSLNPVGIATGIAVAAVAAFATNTLFAEDATAKLRRELRESESSIDTVGEAYRRVGKVFSDLATATKTGAFESFSKEGDRLKQLLASQEDAATSLSLSLRRGGSDLELYSKKIEDVAVAAQESPGFFRALDIAVAGNGKSFDELSRAQQNAVRRLEETNGIRRENNVLVLSATEAQRQLKAAIDRTTEAQELNNRRIMEERDSAIGGAVDDARAALEEEAALAKLGNAERAAEIELKKILAGTTGILTDAQVKSINAYRAEAKAIDEGNEAKRAQADAEREFAKAFEDGAREQVRAQERIAQLDERRADLIRQLNDDAKILLATGEDEIRQKQTQAKLNDLLAQTETDRSSAAGQAIEAAVLRVAKSEELNKRLAEVRDLGADAGATIGRGFVDAARSGATLRQALGSIAEGLSQLTAQRFIIDALAKLGAAAFGSFFGPTPGAPDGNNIGPTQANGRFSNARGGFLPTGEGPTAAARGVLLDRFQTFQYNGRNITTNEGGASTPEAVVPLDRDQYGRLGVHMAGAAPSYVVNVPNAKSAAEARRLRPTMRQMLESVERSSARNRGGLRAGR